MIDMTIEMGLKHSWIGAIINIVIITYKLLDIIIIVWSYKIYKLVSENKRKVIGE